MKYKATVVFEIETDDYPNDKLDSADDIRALVQDILIGDADMPELRHVEVEAQ